jgi:hypothetical protein
MASNRHERRRHDHIGAIIGAVTLLTAASGVPGVPAAAGNGGEDGEALAALAERVRTDCRQAGDSGASCDCMVDGLLARLDDVDAQRFFLLTLEEPADALPPLALGEVAAFAERVDRAMRAVAAACAR